MFAFYVHIYSMEYQTGVGVRISTSRELFINRIYVLTRRAHYNNYSNRYLR